MKTSLQSGAHSGLQNGVVHSRKGFTIINREYSDAQISLHMYFPITNTFQKERSALLLFNKGLDTGTLV